ncbi:MAG: PAS domain S-box protein [Nitrospira sp.]|nr:PAS domain S-box protein [Nitrospira sp.]
MADHTKQSGRIKSRAQDQCEAEETLRPEEVSATNLYEQRPSAESQSAVLEALTAVELAMEGISKLDDTGHYVFVNQQYAALLGYRPDELVGQSWEITVHPDDRPSVLTAFAGMLEIGKAEAELRGVKKNGSVFYKHVVLVKQDGSGKKIPGHFCFVWDVTERKRIEALQDAEKRALELVAKGESLESVLRFICQAVECLASPMLCSVMLADDNGLHLVLATAPNLPGDYNQAIKRIPIGPAIGSCGSAAYLQKPVIAADIATDPSWKHYASVALTHGLKACWSLPIISSASKLLGTLAVYHTEPRAPQPTDLRILERVNQIVAIAIEHAQMMEAVKEGQERFQAAVQGANEGIWDWNLATNEAYFSPRWKAMLGYEDHEISHTYHEWESRLHPEDRERVLSHLSDSLEGRAVRYDVEFRLRKKDGVYCWINACGIVMRDAANRPVRMAGSHTDISERKREEAFQVAEKQTLELVAKGMPLNEVLAFMCHTIEAVTEPMLCSVMLVSKDQTALVFSAGPSLPEEYTCLLTNIPIGPAAGSCGTAAYHGTPIIAEDITVHPLWASCAHVALRHGLRACWSQPIKGSTGRVLGTLAAYYREPRVARQADLRLVERVSSMAALAIEHASMLEAIKESEARFDAFMRHSPAVTFIKNNVGHYVYVNPQFETLASLSRQEAERKTVFDFLPAEIATKISQNDKTVLASGQMLESEESLPDSNGTVRDWLTIKFPLDVGQRPLLGGIAVDITERKRLERANQDQAYRLRLAMDIAKLATWDWNIMTNQVIWSENCEAMKGLPHGSFDGTFEAYQRLVHPEDLPKLLADIEAALSGRKPYRTQHRIVPPTGEVQWVEGNGVVYRDEGGQPIRIVGTVRNITEQKRMEQALRLSEERYARATAVGRVGVWELDVQASTYYGDRNLKAMFGYQPDELSADPFVWLNLVHPDDQSIAMAHWQRIVSREADEYNYELRMIRKDGTVVWTEIRGHAVRTADGQLTHLIGATHDITDRKQSEMSLLRTQFAMDQAVDAVYWIDPQARILYTNEAANAMLGYTKEEFLRMTVHDLNPEFPSEVWPGFWAESREKKVISLETVHLTKDGRRIPIDIRVSFLAYGGQEFHCAFVRDIGKRKAAEEVAHRSLTLLQSVLHTTPIRVFWKDRESRFLGCNQCFALDAGYTDTQEIVGKTDDDLIWHKQAARYQADDRLVMESGLPKMDFEEPGTTPEGKPIWLRTSKVPLRDEQGRVIGVLGVYEDITDRKQMDGALRESQERFELAVSATYDGIWDWNILTGEQNWSDHHLELFGLKPGDLTPTYDLWISLVHPDDAELVRQATGRHLETRAPYDLEVRVRMKDGSYRWFRDRGQAVWDASGRPVRMVGSISDVTERRQAEEAIWRANAELEQRVVERTKELATANRALELEIVERKRVEDRLQRTQYAVDHAADQIFVIDSKGYFLDVNESACRRLGYTKEELLTMSVMHIDPDFPPEAWDACWAAVTREGQRRIETRHRSKSGEIYPVEVVANYLYHGGQELDCAIIRDITDRKQAEAAIRESELRYKLVTEATFDAIALHDNGVLLEVNAGLERMFGYESGELLGRSILELVADESRDQIVLNIQNGVAGPYEAVGRRKDGTTFLGELVVRPYRYRGKEVRLVAGRDITLRKQLELQLARHAEELERQVADRTSEIAKLEAQRAQTEKLAAVGQMAAAVAHEINNPIAGIRNAFTLVKQAVDPTHPHFEFVAMIDREITRVASIVQNMYQLYRKEPSKAEPVNLSLIIRDLESLFAKRLSQLGLTLVVTQAPLRSRLLVPQSDLLQVLMNLVQNALDSSREGGTIRLNVRQDADLIRISVSDEGSGIPPDVLPHIFDPFFTTKTEKGQKGMGLGLSVSQSLVMAMGGRMEVQTEQGAGSTFSIILPEPAAGSQASGHRNIIQEVLTHET